MNEELYSRLSELPSERLLIILAFFMNQYTLEAQTVLRRLGSERGLTDEDVYRLRQLTPWPKSAQYHCQSCRELLDLEECDLRDGIFTCPVCRTMQMINYKLIPGCAENLDYTEEDERSLSAILSEFEDDSVDRPAPVGIGGWLTVAKYTLLVGSIAMLSMVPLAIRDGAATGLIIAIVGAVVPLMLLYLMRRESRLFPRLGIVFLIAAALTAAFEGSADPVWPWHFIRTVLVFAVAAIGIGYLLRSRRVRATFVRPLRSFRAPVPTSRLDSESDSDLIA